MSTREQKQIHREIDTTILYMYSVSCSAHKIKLNMDVETKILGHTT